MDTSISSLTTHVNSNNTNSTAASYLHGEDPATCNSTPSTTTTSSSTSPVISPSLVTSPVASASPSAAQPAQTQATFQTTGSPNQASQPLPHPSAPAYSSSLQPSTTPTNPHLLKKGSAGSADESHTYHAHIDDEKVVEYDPSGRYGKLNVILGKGAYKVVWKALDFKDGYEVAWNCFQTTKQESTELSQEIEILKRVRHPNIIAFRDAWYNNGEFVFITELITSGTLREYIQKLKKPDLKIVRSWTRQILNGLLYLHSHNPPIIHRDIKCDNIFINGAHGEVKIGDMGTAKMKVGKKYTVIGTPEFMAPEMYDERGYSEKVDVYAFGMCLLEMVTAEYPYSECKNAAQIYKKVSSGIKPECLSRVFDETVLSLIQKCIAEESERISVSEILKSPFFAHEPELMLLGVNEARLTITLQVLLKSPDYTSFKFEFDLENDTTEEVVAEMIDEKVVPEMYRSQLISQLNHQIRNFYQNFPHAIEIASARRINAQNAQSSPTQQPPSNLASSCAVSAVVGCSASSSPSSQAITAFPVLNSQHALQISTAANSNQITLPVSPVQSISSQLATVSLQSESPRSWKREAQYKAELTLAQKEALFAVERALIAEKRAAEIELLMKTSESARLESENLIENLKNQLKAMRDHHQFQADEGKKNTTVLEQSFVPSAANANTPKRSMSPLSSSALSASVPSGTELAAATPHDSSLPNMQFSTPQHTQFPMHHQQQSITATTATPPPTGTIGSGSYQAAASSIAGTASAASAYPPDSMSIEELVAEVAHSSQRSPEKAYEWTTKLQMQDILTVGDLRQLHDADWANLNLTVFAMRALKNAVSRRPAIVNKTVQSQSVPAVQPQSSHVAASTEAEIQHPPAAETIEESVHFSGDIVLEDSILSRTKSSPLLMATFGPSPNSAPGPMPSSDFDDYANSGCSFE